MDSEDEHTAIVSDGTSPSSPGDMYDKMDITKNNSNNDGGSSGDLYSEIGDLGGTTSSSSPEEDQNNNKNNNNMNPNMLLEGIVNEDGQMEVELGDDDDNDNDNDNDNGFPNKKPKKMIATKSANILAKKMAQQQRNNFKEEKDDDDDDDDRKPAARNNATKKQQQKERPESPIEEFLNGSPRGHKIKASKMVNLKKARESSSGTPEDAIVLSDSSEGEEEEEDDGDDEPEVVEKQQQQQPIVNGQTKKPPSSSSNGASDINNLSTKQQQPVLLQQQGSGFVARDIEIGERVYCEFSANKSYYWGRVIDRTKKKKSRFYMYHVRFDDGDEEYNISSTKMMTVGEYIASFGEESYRKSMEEGADSGALPTTTTQPPLNPAAGAGAAPWTPLSLLDETSRLDSQEDVQFETSRLNSQELLLQACNNCESCIKPSCGDCAVCRVNRDSGGKKKRCCFQKMCLKIPEQTKLQSYSGLPEGMSFCFLERDKDFPQYDGLVLVSKGGRRYRSFESCFFKTRPAEKVILDFYDFVGLRHRYKNGGGPAVNSSGQVRAVAPAAAASTQPTKPSQSASSASKSKQKALSPHDLLIEKCGQCQNCLKPDCGRCICCRGNKRDPSAKNCCYQKMCLKIDMNRKAQPAPPTFGNFPPGWRFAFDLVRPEQPHLGGLIVLPPPPSALRYFSVEKAVRHMPKVLANIDREMFYAYVGLTGNVAQGKPMGSTATSSSSATGSSQTKRPPSYATANFAPGPSKAKKSRVVVPAAEQTGLSLRQLYEKRCKNCVMCQKPSCGECVACKANKGETRSYKDVCIQKMCCKIKEEDKVQPAKGLPEGWRFYYTDPGLLSWQVSGEHTGLAGLVLLAPNGRQFNNVESACEVFDSEACIPTIARTFYGHVGCHAIVKVPDHVLLGKPFRQRWVDVEGKTKMVYGRVVDASEDLLAGGTRTCTIAFSEKSRSLLNAGFTLNGVSVPSTQQIPQTLAFGGCVDCDPRAVRYDKIPFHMSWLVPDVRHEDFVVDEHGMFAPRLTMQFRGFHLVFTAKTSTIPNAGKGVFVSCSTLTGSNDEYFMLNAGELLDLGVYAPFRRADKKTTHVFLMKNFIHSSQCEEWNFDTAHEDNLFDITDDTNGKLHEIASRHIPAYVNETDGKGPASVYAQHDPEGCVHYLLGHGEEDAGPFTLQANGEEREIFIDYGETYEDVRVRKNYSRLSEQDANERRKQLDMDYKEVLEEINTYNALEIIHCVNFMMRDVFYPNRPYPVSVVIRALLITVLFRKRAESYMEEFASMPSRNNDENGENNNQEEEEEMEAESVCHNGYTRDRMELVIQKSKNLIMILFRFLNSWQQVKETILSNEMYRTSLEYVLGDEEADYHQMTPEKLGELIVGRK